MLNRLSFSRKFAYAAIAACLLIATTAKALSTFTVSNETDHSLGEVTLHLATGSSYLNVLSKGTYVKEVTGEVLAVTINYQTVVKPLSGVIALADGDSVMVGWSSSRITVIDPAEDW